MRTLLVLLLSACACFGQGFTFTDVAFLGNKKVAAAAGGCSTTSDSSMWQTSVGGLGVGQGSSRTYVASSFIVTNTTAHCSVSLVVKAVGSPTWTYEVAVYNDTTPSGSPGTINGSWSSAQTTSGLTTAFITNNITLNLSGSLTAGVTNYIVIQAISSPDDFANYIQFDQYSAPASMTIYSSSDGSTWSVYNDHSQLRNSFFNP